MALPEAQPRVFVSYARSDGEARARDLRERLQAEQVPLWRDREGMEGGRDWWQQITAAIDRVEFLVLVMTPAAVQSAMVRREWRYARQRGVAVYPVVAGPAIDFDSLPRWMRSVHFYDLAHEWRKFVNDLHSRPVRVRVPFMVEDLPAGFVPRPREFEALRDLLLDPEREEPVAVTAALRGAGGFGKTALALALCHDEAIQNAFDDGVLWVTLGERPGDLTARVEDLVYMLSGQRPGFASLETAVAVFAELLADREILIVIDDAWDAVHVRPFLQGGPRCSRVITTRMSDVLPPASRRVEVDAMAQAEAVALLGQGLCTAPLQALQALARRLGEWPLLLKLVNGALRERVLQQQQPLDAALAHVNRALDKRGLTFFDARDATARHDAVASTLGVSLQQLASDELQRLDELAVFPEDAAIPLSTLAAYWARTGNLDEFDTEVLAERLTRLSLVQGLDLTQRTLRLHDVIRRFLIGRAGSQLQAMHRSLLESGRPAHGAWAALPAGEPYWWNWLFTHLLQAGQNEELRGTALDLRYLAAKAVARTAFSAESDLQLAVQACPEEPRLVPLRRAFGQSAHLFGDCRSVAESHATLVSRLWHNPSLQALARQPLVPIPGLDREPGLRPLHVLPDLPHPLLVRTLGSRRGEMRACAISEDGRLVATAASDRHITLWDTASGHELKTLTSGDTRTFSGHWVRALGFDADARLLAAAAGDRRLWVWDTASGALIGNFAGHTDVVTDCALSADGAWLVSSSLDGSMHVWDVVRGTLRHKLAREWSTDARGWRVPSNDQGHWAAVLACAISRDGRRAASGSSDQTLILWCLESGRALRVFKGHTQAVTACAFSPDGRRLASVGVDRTLRLWDCDTGDHQGVVAHADAIQAVAWGLDGAHLVTGSADGTVRVWTADGDEPLHTFSGHAAGVNDCAVSAGAGLVVSAASDGTACLWQLQGGAMGEPGPAPRSPLLACATVPGHPLLFTGALDGTLQLLDVRRGQSRRRWAAPEGSVRACAASKDGRLLVSAGAQGALTVWDGAAVAVLHTLSGHRDGVGGVSVHPSGHLVASVAYDGTLRLWDLRTRARRLALMAQRQGLNACAFSPDGQHLVTAAADGNLTRWSMDFDEALWEAWLSRSRPLDSDAARLALQPLALRGHEKAINQLSFSSDGAVLASASDDHTLRLWNPHTGGLLKTLHGHLEDVTGCDFDGEGTRLASVSSEGGVKVWDVASGRCLCSLQVDGALAACSWAQEPGILAAVGARGAYFFRCRQDL
jgi:WD40 repeat protein